MSVLLSTERPAGVLGDQRDDTYDEDSYTNSAGSPVLVVLRVATTLAIAAASGTIDYVVLAARCSRHKFGGTWGDARLVYDEGGTEQHVDITIVDGPTPLGSVDSGNLTTNAGGVAWTWQHLTDTTITIEQDVTLAHGQTATLRVGEVSAAAYGTATTFIRTPCRAYPSIVYMD